MTQALPNGGSQIRSTVKPGGVLEIALADVPIAPPGDDQVVIRVEAAPINPSDIKLLLAGADPEFGAFGGTPDRPNVTFRLSPEHAASLAGREGQPIAVGFEGAGTVVAAGSNAQALAGKRVAFFSSAMGSLAQYCTVAMNDCMALPDEATSEQGADLFCNPLTALALVETLHQTGQKALIHAAAASSLGQKLVRICREDGIPLVNIVRRAEQAELLRGLGAQHICISSEPTFREDLARAASETGATVAFDPIGGGEMASELILAMEKAAVARLPAYSAYGSQERKTVYVYGHLNEGPLVLPRGNYGMVWNVEGWAMPLVLERAGPERTMALRQRVADNLTTTFASDYSDRISLAQALQRDAMLEYCKKATGKKYLVTPWS